MAKKKVKSKPKLTNKPAVSDSDNLSTDTTNTETIPGSYSSVNQTVFMKLCRLCETKDGPFLNIFEADKLTAKKIDELMPFAIAENDDLPHKICFRCSAKVEELYEFIQKCIKTQESLRKAIGNNGPLTLKTKTRTVWEEKLNKTNMSNDDICDALIKKAMEGIKDMPLRDSPVPDLMPPKKNTRNTTESPIPKKETNVKLQDIVNTIPKDIDEEEVPIVRKTRSTRGDNFANAYKISENLNNEQTLEDSKSKANTSVNSLSIDYTDEPVSKKRRDQSLSSLKKQNEKEPIVKEEMSVTKEKQSVATKSKNELITKEKSNFKETASSEKPKLEDKPEKPFDIMDHVSMIKVTGVGILFQCKLCNRNFVKKELVETHNCAKNGVPKVDYANKNLPIPPEPPKGPTVKYIKMDTNVKKALIEKTAKSESIVETPPVESNIFKAEASKPKQEVKAKPKPRIGPASKVKKTVDDSNTETQIKEPNQESTSTGEVPAVLFPNLPSLNGRYKLVPGPNNTYTLVEDIANLQSNPQPDQPETVAPTAPVEKKTGKKRKGSDLTVVKSKKLEKDTTSSPEIIDVDNKQQPYPVGLFQTVAHHARIYEPPATEPTAFMTPAMKKQSYTVVQTGNPSKLLISTKPQPPPEGVPSKKRQKKSKSEVKAPETDKEPFRVTLEDVAPPKDTGFFTFINVDPLLQPSYVLPTDSIIQESQISTSTPATSKAVESKEKEKYCCNMCGESFSREKKLLAHIQSHYTKMDEEDQKRAEKTTTNKKKSKKQ